MTQTEFDKLLDGYFDGKIAALDPKTVKEAAREAARAEVGGYFDAKFDMEAVKAAAREAAKDEVRKALHPTNREPADYQEEAVQALTALNVTDGTRPNDFCTRGDVMTMLFRFMVSLAVNGRGASDKGGVSDA